MQFSEGLQNLLKLDLFLPGVVDVALEHLDVSAARISFIAQA